MKKVSGYINVRSLGKFNFEFYVTEDITHEQIEEMIKDNYGYIHFETEDEYKEQHNTLSDIDDIKQEIFNAIDNVPITLSRNDADDFLKMDIQDIIDKHLKRE